MSWTDFLAGVWRRGPTVALFDSRARSPRRPRCPVFFDDDDGEKEDDDDSSLLFHERVWPQFLVLDMTGRENTDQPERLRARINERMRNTSRDLDDVGTFDSESLIANHVGALYLPATRVLLRSHGREVAAHPQAGFQL